MIDKKDEITASMSKLKKEKVEVNLNPKKFLLEYSKAELKKLEEVDLTDADTQSKDLIGLAKENLKKNIDEYSNCSLNAVLVPLKYRDLQAVKDSVLEAVKYAQEFNWDEDIRLRAMIREEHTMTVYLALRNKEDTNKRYYSSLEAIAQEPESLIEELYALYTSNFVLTEQERKNL